MLVHIFLNTHLAFDFSFVIQLHLPAPFPSLKYVYPLFLHSLEWAPGPTVSVSSAMGESDHSDVGEVLMVEEMHREGSERDIHMMHHASHLAWVMIFRCWFIPSSTPIWHSISPLSSNYISLLCSQA